MTEELQLFLEDADEQLTFMENALVDMQEGGVNEEDIGALFRAMHTIKGTAGMFGFDDVVGFAHVAESLLSEVRSQNIELTEDMLELFLLAKDHTQTLINIASEHQEIDDDLRVVNDDLLVKLSACMPGAEQEVIQNKPKEEIEDSEVSSSDEKLWYIGVNLHEDFYTSGMDIVNIISFLEDLGEVKSINATVDKIPLLEEYQPLNAYMNFHLKLLSTSSHEEIEEVFEFILDDLDLFIFDTKDSDSLKKMMDSHSDKRALKSYLIEHNIFTQKEIEQTEAKKEQEIKAEVETKSKVEVKKVTTKDANFKPEKTNFSLRVDSSKVDQLINQISEMVIANAKIDQRADELDDTDLIELTSTMSDMLEDVRSSVMDVRMVQVGDTFAKFRRIVG
ncbi:MAG: Hpt domain-containing protein, partial [Campylobacterota bacterium]|nr:Hpt domain-containing protein [Campylobacterota bacterium]